MAAKNKMKYERNRLPGLRKLIDRLIDKSLAYILSDNYKPTMADMNRLIGYYLSINPPKPDRPKVVWVD